MVVAALTLVGASASMAPAQTLTGCEMDQRILTSEGISGKIIGGPVADMCVVALANGNMMPLRMSTLTLDTSEPPPTDVRSIVPGSYACRTEGDASGAITLTVDILDETRYAIAGEGEGAWKAYDAFSIQFLDGPLINRFASAQNSAISFSRTDDGPQLYCKLRS
jgi:hypothetical protein